MKGTTPLVPFRVFGSPYTLILHQHVTYLRLKQAPFKVYCTNFTTTLLYSLYYRARNSFCTLTPSGTSRLQVWQLAETAELDEDVEALATTVKGEVTYEATAAKTADTNGSSPAAAAANTPTTRTQQLLLSKKRHPSLHLACWCVVVYSCWWLAKTGVMYRYIRGESLDVLEGYARYFFIGGVGFARLMAPRFRELMKNVVKATGASELTAPYMDEHFMRLCSALEAHFREHPQERFLLCTPHPTLADVTLGAAFSSFFLLDDPPSSTLADKFPYVTEYAERVTGWRGSTFVGSTDEIAATTAEADKDALTREERKGASADAARSASLSDHPDVVPESLAPCFELMAEVFPFLMSQCASFNAFMAGDGVRTLRREPLEGEWKGCEGYLLPQLMNTKSLMIVDDDVSTVLTRAQDLEVAFLASREVTDDALYHFGRLDDSAESPNATPSSSLSTAEKLVKAKAETTRLHTAAAAATEAELAVITVEPSPTDATAEEKEKAQIDDGVAPPPPASSFAQPLNLNTLDPEDADFYRAYSEAGRRRLGGGATSLSKAVPVARHATTATSHAVVSRSSVMEKLGTLRTMLAKMSCPQYTLTSVFHGRRIYVAVIPEYQVAKVRQSRRDALAAGTAATSAR
jgi:hypothetical protein